MQKKKKKKKRKGLRKGKLVLREAPVAFEYR